MTSDGFLSPVDPVRDLGRFDRALSELEVSAFAWSDDEAARRYARFGSEDPLPDVPPALLNAADIARYVALTGMVYPFHLERDDLKPATYHFRLLGKAVWWDKRGDRRESEIRSGDEFRLEGDSIAFVTLEPALRLPDYVALRFNLRVDNVYRGLLLGTGPIVDPGYVGKLSIPLHNLTTNDYTFRGGDHLIAVEFTKLSPHAVWDSESAMKQGGVEALGNGSPLGLTPELDGRLRHLYLPYKPGRQPRSPSQRDVLYHIEEASPNRPVRSSIPQAVRDSQRAARRSERVVRAFTVGAVVSAVALILSLAAFTISYFDQVGDAQDSRLETRAALDSLRTQMRALERRVPRGDTATVGDG